MRPAGWLMCGDVLLLLLAIVIQPPVIRQPGARLQGRATAHQPINQN